jgi:branched-chain amino acid transport system ATP-binding protein
LAPDTLALRQSLLETRDVVSGYSKRAVLHGVSLRVAAGEVVAVLGHNGAGKTTLLKNIFGTVGIRGGSVEYQGAEIQGRSYLRNVQEGMSFVPAEAPVFRELKVSDNLELAAFTVADSERKARNIAAAYDMFPLLADRSNQAAGTLSGGEQRMLSLAMALVPDPRILLLDEPSLGIAPALTDEIFLRIREIVDERQISVLIVEQNVKAALRIAHRVYFMRQGAILLEEDSTTALARGSWWDLF